MSELSTIKIPEKVYVGFQGRRWQDEVPLGFMTPYTDDKAGEKRRATVDKWAKGYHNQKTFNSVIMENKPMIGFKIGRAIRRSRSWSSSGASKVRIEDPRGFELEITIENLVMLMDGNLIENGELVGECVWGRDGGDNILLPLNSEPYKHSMSTKAAISSAISLREINPGDHIKLITGEEGVYFGGMYPIGRDTYGDDSQKVNVSNKRYVLKVKDTDGNDAYHAWSSIKVGDVLQRAEKKLTSLEMETEIAEAVAKNPKCVNEHSNGYSILVGFTCSNAVTTVKVDQVDFMETELTGAMNDYYAKHYHTTFFLENKAGELLESCNHTNFRHDRKRTGRQYTVRTNTSGYSWNYQYKYVQTDGFVGKKVIFTAANRWVSSGEDTHFEEVDMKRIYCLKETVKTKSGVEFSVFL